MRREPPPETRLECYRFLLGCNHGIYGARFSIGPDGDLYLSGMLPIELVDADHLDRVIGALYEQTERWFTNAIALLRA